jgi:25S rRNA (uracil2634-N3)-methyltransferase
MAGKKKSSLQAALLNQQSRLKQKAQISQAAKSSERAKAAKKQPRKKATTIPFAPTDKILLIGEGNFSFASALAIDPPSRLQHLPPSNITATAYDTEEECLAKYADAREKIDALRAKGVNVLFGVDATKLEKVPQLKGKRWDKVVWNFPHAGQCDSVLTPGRAAYQCTCFAGKGIADQDRNILSNQFLILGFLRSVSGFLVQGLPPTLGHLKKKGKAREEDDDTDSDSDQERRSSGQTGSSRGTVIITLRNVPPYTECKRLCISVSVILNSDSRGYLPPGEETASSHGSGDETSKPHVYFAPLIRISPMGMEGLRTPDDER